MNYWADADRYFEDGHYVEDWELVRLNELSAPVRSLLATEAQRGNKIKSITAKSVELSSPIGCGVLALPDGLSFVCPLRHEGTRTYEGEEDGLVQNLETGEVVFPHGHESADPRA